MDRMGTMQRLLAAGVMLAAMLCLVADAAPGGGPAPGLEGQGAGAGITSEQAITRAINDLAATGDGYRLSHPRHTAEFTAGGLHFRPPGGGPEWRWQLAYAGAGAAALPGVEVGPVAPRSDGPGLVRYERGGLVEQYLAGAEAVEQQFVVPALLPLGGADLVIAGRVESEGVFEAGMEGWLWRGAEGAVHLGGVRVVDAAGVEVPARMAATAEGTRIVVDGAALGRAVYPVLVDPEIGANDFRISDMGGDQTSDAFSPAVAYDSANNRYLVVWQGDDGPGPLADDEFEIYGQLVDGASGAEIGGDFRISDMGADGDADRDAGDPAVAYSSTEEEYLVVWHGDDVVDGELEVYGQRLDGATGAEVGTGDFRISDMGPDGDPRYNAYDPAVAYNATGDEYLVVWNGDDVVEDEDEIYGQRYAAGYPVYLPLVVRDYGP